MSLIAMAVFDTEENKRSDYTRRTLISLLNTVDFHRHRLFVVDNDSCSETQDLYDQLISMWSHAGLPFANLEIIKLTQNVGTAKAVNKAWAKRKKGEHCVKMDNDVVINHKGWVEEMENAIRVNPLIGQVGLKRKDCWEFPDHKEADWKSELEMLSHVAGERWVIIEKVKHVIGTCVMHNSALLDKVGYLYQPGLYGYDDVIYSWRSKLAGFINCFLPHIDIDHIDTGETEFQGWKERHSGKYTQEVIDLVHAMIKGEKSLYYEA